MVKIYKHQRGLTLIELMIVIAIVAILSAIGVPAYQGYLQKAALTDMLQTMVSYKTPVDLCGLENAAFTVRRCRSSSSSCCNVSLTLARACSYPRVFGSSPC